MTDTTLPPLGSVGDRWTRLEANLLIDSTDSLMQTVRTAKAAGSDTILFSDTKTSNWYASDYKEDWEPRLLELQQAVRNEGMAFIVTTASVGYCAPILALDQTLANTMPTVDMPLTVRNGELVPESTATLANGSFEASSTADTPDGWGFQDPPGVTTFLDSQVAADGTTSMRFEGANSAESSKMARISTDAAVQPNQQYVLRFKFKADALNAGFIGPVVRGGETEIALTNQHPSLAYEDGGRNYSIGANNLTTDWVEMELAFNSREFDSVRMYFGSWNTESGTAWIDDVRIEPAATLNIVRRDNLPLTLTKGDGTAVTEGVDVEPVSDPQMGNSVYPGNFDTYHDAPPVSVRPGGNLAEGDTVLLSGHHVTVTTGGQVGCAWNEPRTFELMKEMHRQVATVIKPDGIMIDVEETRTGGWEPTDAPFETTGAAFANHVKTVLDDATAVGGGIPLFMWNDMLDPTMNAVDGFYQTKGDLAGSWVGVDPSKVRIVNWRSDEQLRAQGAAGVAHFADLGFEQIVAGFYDEDVADNHAAWTTAIGDQPGVIGSMYTTWEGNFSQIDEFADLWWTD
jgi:Carbohydrate binding domain